MPFRLSRAKEALAKAAEDAAITRPQSISLDEILLGGSAFVELISAYGVDKKGQPISLSPWYVEFLELVGDMRISHVCTTGCGQIGKSLAHYLLGCCALTKWRLDGLWSFDFDRNLQTQVTSNFQPLLAQWLKRTEIEQSRSDVDRQHLVRISGVELQFAAVSTSSTGNKHGRAAAGGGTVGVSRAYLVREERSQYPPGVGDVLFARLLQSPLPTRPVRDVGTPGGGAGIEAEIEKMDRNFKPFCKCPSCGEQANLDPFGALLKPKRSEKGEELWLTQSGRPLDWWYKDEADKVGTAYFACSSCGAELDNESRRNTYFACERTGEKLRDYLDAIPAGVPSRRLSAAINLYCTLRDSPMNEAPGLIQDGLTKINAADWLQQQIGRASSTNAGGITLEMIRDSISREFSKAEFDTPIVIAGGDQGASDFWLWIAEFHRPKDYKNLSLIEVVENSRRVLLFAGGVEIDQVPGLLNKHGCEFGIVDNEPGRSMASRLCDQTCFEMADQKNTQDSDIKEGQVSANGKKYKCWFIRTSTFQDSLYNAFAMEKYSLPRSWEMLIGSESEKSPVRHLTSVQRDLSGRKWKRPDDHLDDLHFAAMFCEAAFWMIARKAGRSGAAPQMGRPVSMRRKINL